MANVTVIENLSSANLSSDTTSWEQLATAVLRAEGAPENAEITLIFVDEAHISELNKQHMGKFAPTDVLAFPIDEDWRDKSASNKPSPPTLVGPTLVGDIVICPSQCQDTDGIAMRVVHGVLHLCGYDHAEDQERSQMFSLQQKYLKQFATFNLPLCKQAAHSHN